MDYGSLNIYHEFTLLSVERYLNTTSLVTKAANLFVAVLRTVILDKYGN